MALMWLRWAGGTVSFIQISIFYYEWMLVVVVVSFDIDCSTVCGHRFVIQWSTVELVIIYVFHWVAYKEREWDRKGCQYFFLFHVTININYQS